MKVVINETQYFQVLTESKKNEVESVISDSKNFARKILSDVREQFGIDFTFAATWGSVIGGFTKPINDYLHGLHPELTDSQLSLIIFGIILTFFSSNTDKLKQVLEIIKDKKLVTYFDQALMKSYDLRDSFFSFLESLNITVSKVSSMIAYAFLIPITPLIYNIATMDLTSDQIDLLAKGVSHWGATIVSSKMLYRIVKNMINRFRTKI
jgi:hypothetical protein